MGIVLEVVNNCDGKVYALKFSRSGEKLQRRFIREVRVLSSLRHPNVVPILDAQLEHAPPFYVMPLATGSLQDEVENLARKLPSSLQVFRDICAGVNAIHDQGVVHRDLKPSNILRLADGSVVVADLGASKRDSTHSSNLTDSRAVIGTLAYLAPEQLHPDGSRLTDRRSDLFQLGKILYQIVSGLSPAVMDLKRLPIGLAHIVGRATASCPVDRYPDVDSLLAALDAFEQTLVPEPERRRRLRRLLNPLEWSTRAATPTQEELGEGVSLLEQFGSAHPKGHPWFDSIPIPLLGSLAKQRPDDLLTIMNLDAKAVSSHVALRNFRYADFIALRMIEVFASTSHAGLKTRALQILLVSAVALNRYAAMAKFREMLLDVRTLDLALPVTEMLREHLEEFREVIPGLDPRRVHPAIRAVMDELTWIETVSF